MHGSYVFYEQLGYGVICNFNIPWLDSSPRSPIFGEMGKSPPNFAKKLTVPSFGALS